MTNNVAVFNDTVWVSNSTNLSSFTVKRSLRKPQNKQFDGSETAPADKSEILSLSEMYPNSPYVLVVRQDNPSANQSQISFYAITSKHTTPTITNTNCTILTGGNTEIKPNCHLIVDLTQLATIPVVIIPSYMEEHISRIEFIPTSIFRYIYVFCTSWLVIYIFVLIGLSATFFACYRMINDRNVVEENVRWLKDVYKINT